MNNDGDMLHQEPVYAQLNWVWSWRGITLGHLAVCILPAFFFCMLAWWLQETVWSDFPMAVGLVPSLGMAVFVGLVQYRQPPDILFKKFVQVRRARHLSPLRRAAHGPHVVWPPERG